MSVNTINNPYIYNEKVSNDTLSHDEWNALSQAAAIAQAKINDIITQGLPSGGGESEGSSTPVDTSGIISVKNKNGFTNVTLGTNNIKNVNIEPGYPCTVNNESKYGDISLKPGDDIQFCSHHRETGKQDKVVIKNMDGDDNPVKLELHAGEISLCTKGKNKTLKEGESSGGEKMFDDDAKILNLNIITGTTLTNSETGKNRDERGYLKVRAQSIDLRCEKHGGIALQPKGYDDDGNMNKIKFEHGGGDGLEFGTFNTEKTSIFTKEYRFNKDGLWKMATRETEPSGKNILDEGGIQGLPATGALKYVKQNDDFYDIISPSDEQCTTQEIIKTAYALNGSPTVRTKIDNEGNLEISTSNYYLLMQKDTWENVDGNLTTSDFIGGVVHNFSSISEGLIVGKYYTLSEISESFDTNESSYIEDPMEAAANGDILYLAELENGYEGIATVHDTLVFKFKKFTASDIKFSYKGSSCSVSDIIQFVNWAKTQQNN